MQTFDWQAVAAITCVGLALLFVLRRLVGLFLPGARGCQVGCSACPSQRDANATPPDFVSLQSLEDSARPNVPANATDPVTAADRQNAG